MSKSTFNLLPPNATKEDQLNAIFLADGLERNTNLSTLPLEAEVSLLPHLAASYGVDITGLTEKEARGYINDALEMHRHKGTVYAVKKAIAVMFEGGELREWFDVGLKDGLFNVDVIIGSDSLLTIDRFTTAKRLINDAKNVRCSLNLFSLTLPEIRVPISVGLGSKLLVRPMGEMENLSTRSSLTVSCIRGIEPKLKKDIRLVFDLGLTVSQYGNIEPKLKNKGD